MEFGKKIKSKDFKIGYLVWKENINKTTVSDEAKGKFEPNWIGPFIFIDAIGSRAYKLLSMDGREEPKTFNSMHLKKFFA